MTATAKLFKNGRSQAVRLPKEFRFEGTEVAIRREGSSIVLEPIGETRFDYDTWREEMDSLGAQDFMRDGEPTDPPPPPETFDVP